MSEPRWRQIQRDAGETPVPAEPPSEMSAFLSVCETLGAEPIDTLVSDSGASTRSGVSATSRSGTR